MKLVPPGAFGPKPPFLRVAAKSSRVCDAFVPELCQRVHSVVPLPTGQAVVALDWGVDPNRLPNVADAEPVPMLPVLGGRSTMPADPFNARPWAHVTPRHKVDAF